MPVQLSSIIIDEEKLNQIKSAIAQLQYNRMIFDDWGFGSVFEKGTAISLLFHGIPGTGKTLMAQAIADYLAQDLVVIGSGDIETSEPGGAERAIQRFFKVANVRLALNKGISYSEIKQKFQVDADNDPTEITNPMTGETKEVPINQRWHGRSQVLLFDECDSLLVDRNNVGVIMSAQINTLLGELERFDGVVIFTTNRIGKLDGALERRITAKIEFEFPNKEQRKMIWARMVPQKAPIDMDVSFDELAEFELVGGNIKNVVLNAARDAAYRNMCKINRECFFRALQKEIEGLKQFANGRMQDKLMRMVNHQEQELRESMDAAGGITIEKVKSEEITKTEVSIQPIRRTRISKKRVVKKKGAKRGRSRK